MLCDPFVVTGEHQNWWHS